MFLTHLDKDGRDTPPILIENATAANRAINIPEFVNIPPDGLQKIDVPAADFYVLFDEVVDLANKGQWEAALAGWRNILKLDPENAKAHNNLGVALIQRGAVDQGVAQFREAIRLNPTFFRAHFNLALPLYDKGNHDEAIAHWRFATEIEPWLHPGI
jgi:tetratricopeptide (TPR) repeat protein